MPPVTRLRKRKEAMEPYPISSSVGTSSDPITPVNTHNPSPSKLGPSTQDIEEFMNQPGNATLVNAIIDKNLPTIIANFQRDKTEEPTFPTLAPLSDPSYSLFGVPIAPIEPFDPNTTPQEDNKPFLFEAMDPNIPSSQLGAPIPPPPPHTITQSLVHITPHQSISTQTKLPFLPISGVAPQSTSLPISFPPYIPPPTSASIPISGTFSQT